MVADLVEDLLHLERGGQRLDEERRADRAALEAEGVLGEREEAVPPARLEKVLDLRDVERGRLALRDERIGGVDHAQRKIEEAAGDGLVVDAQVALVEVQAAHADHQHGHVVRVEAVLFRHASVRVVLGGRQRPARRGGDVLDAGHDVGPRRLHAVLEVDHRGVRALPVGPAREHVDDHPGVRDGPRDLDAAHQQVGRERLDGPPAMRGRVRVVGQVARRGAGVPARLAVDPGGEEVRAVVGERTVQLRDERDGLGREDAAGSRRVGAGVEGDAVGEGDGREGTDEGRAGHDRRRRAR